MADPDTTDIVPIPATTLQLPVTSMDDFERYEGMYVSIESSDDERPNKI